MPLCHTCSTTLSIEATAASSRGEMQIHLSNPACLGELSSFLALDDAAHVETTGPADVDVWWVDSRNAWAQQMELELRLRAWMAAHPDVILTVTP
jgi:hypothetical protein